MKKALNLFESLFVLVLLFVLFLLCIMFFYKIYDDSKLDEDKLFNVMLHNLYVEGKNDLSNIELLDDYLYVDIVFTEDGEYLSFTFDVTNDGIYNGILVSKEENVSKDNDILYYDINYIDGSNISEGDMILAGETKKIKVSIYYPEQDNKVYDELNLKLELKLNYSVK